MSVQAVVVDENGISIKSFNEIRSALESDFKSVFSDLNTDPSSPDGMLIDLVAYAIMEVAQNIQAIFANLDATTAQGAFLSNIAYMAGLPRYENEDDDSLRMRIANASHTGLATLQSMTSYLLSCGLEATVLENTSDKQIGGNAPHSVSVVVPADYSAPPEWQGTKQNYVASCIWKCKPAGISTNGDISGIALDESSLEHIVNFATRQQIAYSPKVVINAYGEENLPQDYQQQIKDAIINWANDKMTSGKDIIPQRFCAPIYDNVDGIENVTVYVKKKSESSWSSDIVRINPQVIATFSDDDIQVVVK